MFFSTPLSARSAYYRGATHFSLFRYFHALKQNCCFTSVKRTSSPGKTHFWMPFWCVRVLLRAPPLRRWGSKCAYCRGATLIFHENVCFVEAKRTSAELQSHAGTILEHSFSIFASPGPFGRAPGGQFGLYCWLPWAFLGTLHKRNT